MNNFEFAEKVKHIALKTETLYILGCFGAPMNAKNRKRYTSNNTFNKNRSALINSKTSSCYGFDCVGLIKGVLWGWCEDPTKTYGGATYVSNRVPDLGANGMIKVCKDVSTDFKSITLGEVVWLDGHIGVYIGEGLVVECTPKWDNKVQITALANIGNKSGYNSRRWTSHGKLPYIDYISSDNGTALPKKDDNINEYVVKSKDTLWGIAKTLLGNGARYKDIMLLNGLKTTVIREGQKLLIPPK